MKIQEKTFISLSDLIDDRTTEILKENGAFFAFSKKQFEEGKKEGVIYTSLDGNLICPKENVNKLLKEFDENFNEGIRKHVEMFDVSRIIQNEYFNHETQLTGDVKQVIDVLHGYIELFPELFTEEIIKKECKKAFSIAVQNDWF